MVGTALRLDDVYTLPLVERTQDFPYFSLFLPKKDLSTIFGCKHHMIFAVPRCVSQCVVIIAILHLYLLVICFCRLSVRISNPTKSFLLSQRRNVRRLFRTTSLAGGFLHTKNSGLATGFQLLLFAHFCFWGIIIFCSQSTIVHLQVFYATYIFCPAKFHAPSTAIKVVIVYVKFKV